jgi:hypothetical protein
VAKATNFIGLKLSRMAAEGPMVYRKSRIRRRRNETCPVKFVEDCYNPG